MHTFYPSLFLQQDEASSHGVTRRSIEAAGIQHVTLPSDAELRNIGLCSTTESTYHAHYWRDRAYEAEMDANVTRGQWLEMRYELDETVERLKRSDAMLQESTAHAQRLTELLRGAEEQIGAMNALRLSQIPQIQSPESACSTPLQGLPLESYSTSRSGCFTPHSPLVPPPPYPSSGGVPLGVTPQHPHQSFMVPESMELQFLHQLQQEREEQAQRKKDRQAASKTTATATAAADSYLAPPTTAAGVCRELQYITIDSSSSSSSS